MRVTWSEASLFAIIAWSVPCLSLTGMPNLLRITAKDCGAQAKKPQVFAKLSTSSGWKKYASQSRVPEKRDMVAHVWGGKGQRTLLSYGECNESGDFCQLVYFCFDTTGKAESAAEEFRTAWGWGYTEQDTFSADGATRTSSYAWWDLTTNQKLTAKPTEPDNEPMWTAIPKWRKVLICLSRLY